MSNAKATDQSKRLEDGVGTKSTVQGVVVRAALDKTAKVEVVWNKKHPTGKYIPRKTTYLVHDENNECKLNDVVKMQETRPYSKRKFMVLKSIVKAANTKGQEEV